MASFQRLVLIFILFFSANAYADYPKTAPYYHSLFYNGTVHDNADFNVICNDYLVLIKTASPSDNYAIVSCDGTGVRLQTNFGNGSGSSSAQIAKWGYCGTVASVWGTGICSGTPPVVCTAGQVVSSGVYANGTSPLTPFPNITCDGTCVATFSGIWPDTRSCVNDSCTYYAKGNFAKNGQTCTGGTAVPAVQLSVPMSPEQAALKALQDQKQADFDAALAAKRAEDAAFNAALKAAAGTSAADAAAKKLAADAAAQKAATAAADAKAAAAKAAADAAAADAVHNDPNATQAQKDAADGLSSVSGAASAAGAAAATAAAGTANTAAASAAAAAGNAAADAKATEKTPDTQLCDKYPNAPACLVHTADAGFCVAGKLAGFKCDGDAITCSQTKAQQEAFCANLQTDGLNDFGTSLINQEKTFTSDVGALDNPTQIQVGSLNSSSFLTKSCLADLNFSIVGQNIVLPLSKLCDGLQIAGRIVKFFAYMIAAKIIFS